MDTLQTSLKTVKEIYNLQDFLCKNGKQLIYCVKLKFPQIVVLLT